MYIDNSEKEKNERRLRHLIIGRVGILTVFLAVTVLIDIFEPVYFISPSIFWLLYSIIGLMYLLSLFYAYMLRKEYLFVFNVYLQLSMDVVLVTFLVYLTGSIGSNYSLLYTLIIIYSVIFIGRNGGLVFASISSIAYGTLLDLEYYRIIPTIYAVGRDYSVTSGDVFVRIIVHIVSFYVLAFLASIVVEQEKKTRSLLEEKESAFNQLDLLFRSIIESVDTGVMTVNLQGRIKTFNRAAEEITGFQLKEIENRRIEEIFPQFSPFFDQKNAEISKNRRELIIYGQNNKKVHLGCSLSPLKDRHGRQIGHILIFQDLTEIKLMEDNLEKSKRLALIGEMAAGLAHEMRTPLASITGSIQLLGQTTNLEETDRRLMQIILRGKDQLDNFVRDFLLLAKPIPLIREVVDVNEVADETLEQLAVSPESKTQVKVLKIFSSGNYAFANRDQIRHIIQNLVLNAMQAIDDHGTVSVEIKTIKLEDRKSYAEIKITDDGCGIEDKYIHRVFEPFFTNKEKGTGLGLAIVSRIVDGYGGKIRIVSRVDQGTSITVWLPDKPK